MVEHMKNENLVSCFFAIKQASHYMQMEINVEANKYKTRLIARGCEQIIRVNFGETFAPITKWNTIETMNALARSKGWKAHHLDVKTTFHLHDEVYM
jgi:hypothetical protein